MPRVGNLPAIGTIIPSKNIFIKTTFLFESQNIGIAGFENSNMYRFVSKGFLSTFFFGTVGFSNNNLHMFTFNQPTLIDWIKTYAA